MRTVPARSSPLAASRRGRRAGAIRFPWEVVALLTTTFFALFPPGCEGGQPPPASPRPPIPPGPGVVTGTVRLSGPVPQRRVLTEADCHTGGPPPTDESVVADGEGRLSNVVVFVKDGPPVALPAPAVAMDQVHCRFEPHVVAVRTGQTLRFHSSDPVPHNVHGTCEANPPFNLAMGSAGQSEDRAFSQPEFFRVKCDVHPWMTGWVAVLSHPLFAVTGNDGRFEIRGLPPGSYTLVAWHERYGKREQAVMVPAGQVAVDLTFGPAER